MKGDVCKFILFISFCVTLIILIVWIGKTWRGSNNYSSNLGEQDTFGEKANPK